MKKSYTLTVEQTEAVKKQLKILSDKFSKFDHIICESSFDAGLFFEHELDE